MTLKIAIKRFIILPKYSTPRWIVLVLDLILSMFGLMIAYLLRFEVYANWKAIKVEWDALYPVLPLIILTKLIVFYFFKIHKALIRHTTYIDIRRLFFASITTTVIFGVMGGVRVQFFDGKYLLPISVLILEFILSFILLMAVRFAIKVYHFEFENTKQNKIKKTKNLIIYGAGVSGLMAKRTIDKDPTMTFKIVAFIDDNEKLVGNRLENIFIFSSREIQKLIDNYSVDELLIAIQNPEKTYTKPLVEICLQNNVEVKSVPSFKTWINGEFSLKQIKNIKIEDLLGRKPIVLDRKKVDDAIKNRVILVTGAAGSIGSGLVRQLLNHRPDKIVLLDQAESPVYDFQQELLGIPKTCGIEFVIVDITDFSRMDQLFNTFKPNIVFHAAAYKHVPLMEENPLEAVKNNVLGTKNLVDLSDKYSVEKFVMISTDKAVNPTNVMGASKRIAEIYAQKINENSNTQFVTTRFGNVLGSNGSVIPLFKKQIEAGGPITVTHPDVTRFFMTIPEACLLVLEAGAMGNGGEIFVFDMGESVKIIDLAEKMIKLSGLEVDRDILIQITGLRPGEKLYEELLANEENTLPTYHPQILRAKSIKHDDDSFQRIDDLIASIKDLDDISLVVKMKSILPEFKSNNSIFSKLDK
jgi:FlaA1/EpsC-like NDP-sugar epimerase